MSALRYLPPVGQRVRIREQCPVYGLMVDAAGLQAVAKIRRRHDGEDGYPAVELPIEPVGTVSARRPIGPGHDDHGHVEVRVVGETMLLCVPSHFVSQYLEADE